ncbi:G-protein coupled receptor 182-like [Narcine bancroftii]|uniref:G-protein coupled receptor 182-like n=1 Tax=Narcine bancroftii TaxID=1343680 RepID=UPI0038314AB8
MINSEGQREMLIIMIAGSTETIPGTCGFNFKKQGYITLGYNFQQAYELDESYDSQMKVSQVHVIIGIIRMNNDLNQQNFTKESCRICPMSPTEEKVLKVLNLTIICKDSFSGGTIHIAQSKDHSLRFSMEDSTVTTPGSTLHNDDSCINLRFLNFTALHISEFCLYLLFFAVGLVENTLVLWINWQMKKAKKESNLYIFNLALADMGVILDIPFRMIEIWFNFEWSWGTFLCKLDAFLYDVNLYSNIFFLTCLSADRFFSLRYPTQAQGSRDRRVRRLVCGCMWTLAVLLSIPSYIYNNILGSEYQICMIDNLVAWYVESSVMLLSGFVIPVPIILVSNSFTIKAAKAINNKEGTKTCKLVYAYTIVFLICWSPFFLFTFLSLFDWSTDCIIFQMYFFHSLAECLAFSHCIMNPILYNFMHKDFRYHLATSVVKFLPKIDDKEDDNISISSETRHIVLIS